MRIERVKVDLSLEEIELIKELIELPKDESENYDIVKKGRFEDGTKYELTWFFNPGRYCNFNLSFKVKNGSKNDYTSKDVDEALHFVSANIDDVKYIAHISLDEINDFNSVKEEIELTLDYFDEKEFKDMILYTEFKDNRELIKICYLYLHEAKFISNNVVKLLIEKLAYYGYDKDTIITLYDYNTDKLGDLLIHLTIDKLYNLKLYKPDNIESLFLKWLGTEYC